MTNDELYVTTKREQRRMHKKTTGWKFLICWKDDIEEWIALKSLKTTNPVDIAEIEPTVPSVDL